jgi:chromosome segregation ATPase
MATRSTTKRINNKIKPASSTHDDFAKDKENCTNHDVLSSNKRKDRSVSVDHLEGTEEDLANNLENDDETNREELADNIDTVDQCKEKIAGLEKKLKEYEQQYERLKVNYERALKVIKNNKYTQVEGEFKEHTLSSGQVRNLIKHVKEKIFPKVKVVNTAIIEGKPELLSSCHNYLQVTKVAEQQMLQKSIVATVKYALVQKRRYCKDKLMTAYQGKFIYSASRYLFLCFFHF